MSEHSPGSFHLAERTMDLAVEEALRDAKARRLAHEARAGRESRSRFYSRALVWLGQRLATWGERLQERYSAEGSAPFPQVG